jgi:hypothetical protein
MTEELENGRGFAIQAVMFALIGGFLVAVAAVYWFLTYEDAGSVMLALSGALALTVAAYLGWRKPAHRVPPAGTAEPPDEEPWFPAASGWPFALGIGFVLVANGLLLGLWLLLPAAAFLTYALAGFIQQSRVRG